jgi:uncharacterized protein
MDVRRITAHPEVKANLDKMALQRGPLVYCVEWPDVPDSLVLNLVTGTNAEISAKHAPGLLNGVYTLDFLAQGTAEHKWRN